MSGAASEGSLPVDLNQLYRRITWRLIPFLIVCYMFAVIDRLNIAMAKLQMLPALGFSEAVYGLGAGFFFIGYLLFDIPSNLILHRVGARWWIGRIMISWGVVSVGFAFVTTPFWFYVLRFLLGVAEAGFFAGLVLYATYWFPAPKRGGIYALILLAVPLAGMLGNPLAGWIMTSFHNAGGFDGWQRLFIIEGLPSIVLGFISLVFLTNGISEASWLTPAEKAALQAELDAEEAAKPPSRTIDFVISPLVWLMCAICFAISSAMYALGFWTPSLIQAAGVTSPVQIGLYSAIPSAVAILPLLFAGWSADRTGERRWHVAVPLILAGLALAISTTHDGLATAIICLTLATAGAYVALSQFWNLPAAVLSGYGAAGGIALINSIGNLAGFFSPSIIGYLKTATGSITAGLLGITAIIILGGLLTLAVPRRLVDTPRNAESRLAGGTTRTRHELAS
ncbi:MULTISPECIES: MFS transporter [unclassified Beijerinckia]|uniref:MFS transporter n=1 Tax=unclassified Beijerinckia TaxID=2638183 RepID=UPI000895B98B|nr:MULTISPECIES: MFS transporter [unclassified Beijerinckia]MDH7799004.1 MFS family permease [Beijerinckia sp. GAS462]SED84638.1 Sugar phosphate permease [Beijerinckia sp. 28-YEA-48]